jgi:hypothetical protein
MSLDEIFFKKNETINNAILYYTNISKISLLDNNKNIVELIDKILEKQLENYWIWIIDISEVKIKDCKNISKFILITNMISNKYSKNLLQINIINPRFNFFNIIFFFTKLYLDNNLKKKINIVNYLENDDDNFIF